MFQQSFFSPKFEWNFHFVALPATRNSLPPHPRSHPAELFRPDASKWVEWFFLSFFFFFVFLLCLCNIVDLWRESAWMHSAEAGFERKKNRNQNTKTKKKKRNRNEEEKEFRPLRNSCGRNDADAFTSIPFGVKLPTAFFYSLRSVISPLSVALLYGDLSV